ncbi:hypothetical protein CDAR_256551 [Caerostris darwini]|uniref:Uncharacterized protein n=1 Tax=Caerostris darwini TaxID=1538125 RepID=A0AAV4PFC5_9ARAC|nr:hypothetical protein CDAR_256551 [Caerostris darwini]
MIDAFKFSPSFQGIDTKHPLHGTPSTSKTIHGTSGERKENSLQKCGNRFPIRSFTDVFIHQRPIISDSWKPTSSNGRPAILELHGNQLTSLHQ